MSIVYAEHMAARRLSRMRFTGGSPLAVRKSDGPHWTGRVELIPHMLGVPLRRRAPIIWFVNSMSDLFHESLKMGADRAGVCGDAKVSTAHVPGLDELTSALRKSETTSFSPLRPMTRLCRCSKLSPDFPPRSGAGRRGATGNRAQPVP